MVCSQNRVVMIALAVLCMACGVSVAQDAVAQDAVGNTPWHYVDFWWHFEKPVAFQSYSVDIELSGDIDPKQKLYISPIGIGHLSGQGFYGGIQSQSDGFAPETGGKRQYIRKGAIFSRWGERDFAAIRRSQGGLWESGGYEGPFISVRNGFPWTKGRYTYAVRRLETERVGDNVYTWVGGFVRSHASGEERYIGSLRFEGAELTLGKSLASFLETYGNRIPLDQIPSITVTFSNWRINGEAVRPESAVAVYLRNVPQYAASRVEGDAVIATLGEAVDRTKQPRTVQRGKFWQQDLIGGKGK